MNTIGGLTEIFLQPKRVLMTYGDGIQQFKVEGKDLITLTSIHSKHPHP